MLSFKKYSPSEISLHSAKRDCWLSIRGKVYDVTTFLEYHPGGVDVMLQAAAGGDATLAFDDVGHSSTAINMMEGYVVGTVEGYASKDEQSAPSKRMAGPKRLQQKQPAPSSSRGFEFLLLMLALVSIFGAWYYLNIYAKAKA